ncbi:MAG: sulfatase-like hydrolase/transferase, partial [Planctomycetota bacterium]
MPAPDRKRPNILFLMSDEHRADVTGYEGNPVVRTPTLDHLAATGVTFRNAYTPSPICVPARQCMMSGQLPKTCSCEGWIDLAPNYLTFSRLFSQYAYETVACGKLHHQGPDQSQGWVQRPAGDVHVTPAHIPGRLDDQYKRFERPFGDYKWSDTKEVLRAGIGRSHCMRFDDMALEGALYTIENHFVHPYYDREQLDKPMMLKLSLLEPHYPYFTDRERFTYYLNRVEPYLDQPVFDHPWLGRRQVRPEIDASPRELRRATAAYYGMVERIDSMYGTTLEALEHAGQELDDWIIIYTTDHGEMLGEHGIWEKQKFFEGSVRVPLIIRWPRGFDGGRVVDENVNLCDLFATLCELAGIPTPDGLDSRSLVPLLRGEATDWDNESVSQRGGEYMMIKRDALKYQYYGPEMPEVLFDLEADPGETENLIDRPEYAEHMEAFRKRLGELGHGQHADGGYVNAG